MLSTTMVGFLALAAALGLVALRSRPPISNLHERLEWISTHEAGHTIVAWCCPLVGRVTGVSIEPLPGGRAAWSGLTTHDWRVPPGLAERQWWDIVIAMAGLAAEMLTYGELRTLPPRRDILDALAVVRVMCGEHACPPATASLSLPLSVRCSPVEASTLEHAFRQAYRLLADRRDMHSLLARTLVHTRHLSALELEAMLGSRG